MKLSFTLSALICFGIGLASTVPVRRDDPMVHPNDGECISTQKYLGFYNGVASTGCGDLVCLHELYLSRLGIIH